MGIASVILKIVCLAALNACSSVGLSPVGEIDFLLNLPSKKFNSVVKCLPSRVPTVSSTHTLFLQNDEARAVQQVYRTFNQVYVTRRSSH